MLGMELDSTQIGILGKHLLIDTLMIAGFEVAGPLRDRGIDLIAFNDGKGGEKFNAWPIQLKSSSGRIFSVDKKYEKLPRLLIVYAWNVASRDKSRLFALTYTEAVRVLVDRKHATQKAWTEGNKWADTKVGVALEKRLKRHEVTPDKLREKLLAIR
jgi:hypothetical protein